MLVFGASSFKPWHRYRELRKFLNLAVVALVWLACYRSADWARGQKS
jgi:hypothetical protein